MKILNVASDSKEYKKFKKGLEIKTPLLTSPITKLKNWFDGLEYVSGDILYLKPDNRFGEFRRYGKRAERLWTQIWKKNSKKPMAREWALIKDETILAFKYINGEYISQDQNKFKMVDGIPQIIIK